MKTPALLLMVARLFIGRRDAGGNRDQARKALAGAILSVAVSLIPLVTVMQVADGMIQGISERFVELGTYHARIIPFASSDLEAARAAAAAAPGVSGAWMETQTVGVVFANGRREGAAVRGVEAGFLSHPSTMHFMELLSGHATLSGANDAVIGTELATKLQVDTGDSIHLITIRRTMDGRMIPRITILSVVGVISAGYRDLDAQWLFIRQETAARLAAADSSYTFIGIKGSEPFQAPHSTAVSVAGVIPPGFRAVAWPDIERSLFESLGSTRTMLLIIMSVTVAVAVVNVSGALSTLVYERRQEIAVLRSIGADRSDIIRIFVAGGTTMGALGAVVGIAGGLWVSVRINEILRGIEAVINTVRSFASQFSDGNGIAGMTGQGAFHILDPGYYLQSIPVDIRYTEIALVAVLTVILSFMASFGPSIRASRLLPLEGLRHV